MKLCNSCYKIKSFDSFGKHKRHKDGLQNFCKDCKREIDREYRIKNHEKLLKIKKIYRENNKEKIYNQKKKSYLKNRNYYLNKFKDYRFRNKDKINKYVNDKYSNDVNFKISKILRGRILKAIKGKKILKTFKLVGCSIDFLKQHLQQTAIRNGYNDFNINNYDGSKYHIDHIIPCSVFNLSCSYHQKLCFNYKNLQILKANENIIKSNKN